MSLSISAQVPLQPLGQCYSSAVQANARRRPIAISPKLRDLLNEKVNAELLIAEEGLYRDELTIFRQCLEAGQLYRGVYYFGPLAWDWSIDENNIYVPRWTVEARPNMYVVPTHQWGLDTAKTLVTTGRILMVPHPYITSFVKIGEELHPCLFRTRCRRARDGLILAQ
jgi:hypothetical protein